MKTNTKPPIEIYDVLHECEAKGIELPDCIDEWWEKETAINENPKCLKCKGRQVEPECNFCPDLD